MRQSITDKIKGVDKLFVVGDSDITSDNVSDNKSDIQNDKTSDNDSAVTSDKSSDKTTDVDSDINSDIYRDMFKPKKQPKYVDAHERRTHYILKENVKFIDELYERYNQDKSETVNKALNLYRDWIKKQSKRNGKK